MRQALLIAVAIFSCLAFPQSQQHVSYGTLALGKAGFHYVIADLNSEAVCLETVFSDRLTSIGSLLGDEKPAAALTGTFFAWENQRPIAEVILDGEMVSKGRRGSVVAVDWFGKAHIFHPNYGEVIDWFPYRFALRGAVRLIENGTICPNPKSQKFRDSSIWGKAPRTGIGITAEGKVVLMATRSLVTLSQLGKAFSKLGVKDAVNLDGGGSTALYYRGSMVISTGRRLCNMLAVYERSPFDSSYRAHLNRIAQTRSDNILRTIGRKRKP